MKQSLARIRGLAFIIWQSRHMAYHVLLGLLWAWFLRERWGEFNAVWICMSVFGSLLPDAEHIYYFLGYGRQDAYATSVLELLRGHHWRRLFLFVATEHKHNTSLAYHNIYTVIIFIVVGLLASFFDWQVGVILCGAMVSHYLFDMLDDMFLLGALNPNWKRWGRGESEILDPRS